MFKAIGAVLGFGVAALVVIAAVVAINAGIILGIVWLVKTVLF